MAGAKRFEDLLSWQRMHELNIEVWKATNTGPVTRDFRFVSEIRDAADSSERNVAEGFGRYGPPQFANFLDFSRASAMETKSLLKKGLCVGYFTAESYERLDNLAERGLQAVAKFQRYLRSPEAKRNAAQRYSRRRAERQNDQNENVKNENDPNGSNDPNDPNV
jgi:four helix bundle protein